MSEASAYVDVSTCDRSTDKEASKQKVENQGRRPKWGDIFCGSNLNNGQYESNTDLPARMYSKANVLPINCESLVKSCQCTTFK